MMKHASHKNIHINTFLFTFSPIDTGKAIKMKRSRTCFDVRSFEDESGAVGKRCDSCPVLTGISYPAKLDARIYSVSSLGNKLPDDGETPLHVLLLTSESTKDYEE